LAERNMGIEKSRRKLRYCSDASGRARRNVAAIAVTGGTSMATIVKAASS
jgi:hypothetical protein